MSVHPHPVRTLADLAAWSAPGPSLALLGHPVAHSVSPAMHLAALAVLAEEDPRFRTWGYDKFDISAADLPRALALLHARGFVGLNLTVPHKETGLALAESADAFAKSAGAANTLLRTATGWHAANTDGPGLADAVRSELGLGLRGRSIILLGAGGAARAAAAQCLQDGVSALWIGNRGPDRLAALLTHLAPLAHGIPVHGFPLDQPPAGLPAGALVINSTSVGLHHEPTGPVDLRRLPAPAAVFDMIYNPPDTALLRQAAGLGLPHASGLAMLVHQGAHALSRWTGRPAPAGVMSQAARTALSR
ncbi:MAG: shikimate dehydrogenase family protein [Opitutales bacterium]